MAVTILGGGPPAIAVIVARKLINRAVAWFWGMGVAVTTKGVTQLGGSGVGVPKRAASCISRSASAKAVAVFCGVGTLVMTT